ncbi:protein SOGA1 [Pimephales promelas]|nr:protein SOGA1 [Pimephales promelas]
MSEKETLTDVATSSSALQRTTSVSALSEFKSLLDTHGHMHQSTAPTSILACTDLSDLNKKNWKYLTSDSAILEKHDQFKTWDCPSTNSNSSFPGLELSKEYIQRSYTAPDKTGIRIYYSPPTVRRMERRPVKERPTRIPSKDYHQEMQP